LNTPNREYERLLRVLYEEYEAKFAKSKAAHARAGEVLVDGVSHAARLFEPYPFRAAAAKGARVYDIDGNELIDFWQGHYANILGHNPAVVREALTKALKLGSGLQTGIPEERQAEFSLALAEATGSERVRLTTSGTLATMYAIMLSRAFTGRNLVVKVSGGWHGAHPLALKGVHRTADGFDQVDSTGLPDTTAREIIVTPFNDVDSLRKIFRSMGDRIACFILEPTLGSGFIPATAEFMSAARELTNRCGALLILDQVITGFRYCASGVDRLYKVRPDLSTFGKIIGGGMPVSAVAGRADVMDLACHELEKRVWFNGGTFSAHPLSLLAGKTMIDHLRHHETEIYPTLAARAERLRTGVEKAFADRGILARCTGHADRSVAAGSLVGLYFPVRDDFYASSADEMQDPNLCDVTLRDKALKVGMLLQDVYTMQGLGALSYSHTDQDLERVFEACDVFARRVVANG